MVWNHERGISLIKPKHSRYSKAFYKKLFIIALPIILQNLIASSLNLLDTFMIGKLGEVELASVGIANQFYFLFNLLIFGLSAGCAVFIAQLWGKEDVRNIRNVLGLGLIAGLVTSSVFTILGVLFPKAIIAIFNSDQAVIEHGASYLIIAACSYVFTAITFCYAASLRSVGYTMLPMWASLAALITNGVLNYGLIFGNLGFAPLGVKGAAIATLIARVLECLIIIVGTYIKKTPLACKWSELFCASKDLRKGLLTITLPIVANEACWGLANVTYAVIYGRIGTGATAAMQICTTILNLFTIITYGLANAAVVMIGNEIGAGQEDCGREYAKKILRLSIFIGLSMGVILAGASPGIVAMFHISEGVRRDAILILLIYGAFMSVKVYNSVQIVGILRGGGDTKYGSVVQMLTLWFLGIPSAFVCAFLFHLPVYLVVLSTMTEEIVKLFILKRRFRSQKWIRNVVEQFAA